MRYLQLDRPGFGSLNHCLIAIMLFLLLLLLPIPLFSDYLHTMVANPISAVIVFLIVAGAALLPDIDNDMDEGGSSASWSLGAMGRLLSTFMITVSSLATSTLKGKRDYPPKTQHRYLWHTLLIPILIFVLVHLFAVDSPAPVYEGLSLANLPKGWMLPTALTIFLVVVSVYVGSSLLFRKLLTYIRIFKQPAWVISGLVTFLVLMVVMFLSTLHDLKMYGYAVALGYLFHLFGDMWADSGIPALFPVTGLRGQFWMRCRLLPRRMTVKTGSTHEMVLSFVFLAIDCILLWLVLSQL